MSIFKRIGSIIRSNREIPETPAVHPFEGSGVGDIVNVDLEEYIVTGKVAYFDRGYAPHRYAYYLQSGRTVSCLLIEKGRAYDCFKCDFVEGSLDDPSNVPTRLDVDGAKHYELEHHRKDVTRTEGNTDFRNGDEVLIWSYFANEEEHFFLQWQDGKFVAMQGMRIPSADVKFMHSGSPPSGSRR